jgi:hypothetical protein
MPKLVSLKSLAAVAATSLVLLGATAPSQAASGTVNIRATKAGFIVGVGGGSGTLRFEGRTYRLSVGGISMGTIGVATADLVGTASNMRTASDIAGTYTAVSASVAIAGGGKVAELRNEKGVVLKLKGRQIGFEASLNLSGLSLSLQ